MESFIPRSHMKAGYEGIQCGAPYYYDFPKGAKIIRFWQMNNKFIACYHSTKEKIYIHSSRRLDDIRQQLADPRVRLATVGTLIVDKSEWSMNRERSREATIFVLDPDDENQSKLYLLPYKISTNYVIPLNSKSVKLIPIIPKLKERLIKSYKRPLKKLME